MPQEELGTWNFQWQPFFLSFPRTQSSTQPTFLVPCLSCPLLISATAMEDSSVEAQIPLAPSCLKCRGTEFLSVFCPHKLPGLPESAWFLQSHPGSVKELMYLRSVSTSSGWKPCPLRGSSGRHPALVSI